MMTYGFLHACSALACKISVVYALMRHPGATRQSNALNSTA